MQLGDIYRVEIVRLGLNGEGVGQIEGMTLFVSGVLPGESAEVKITEIRKNFARGSLVRLLKASPDRVAPPCPVFGTCGGCQIMHLSYEGQLSYKRQKVVDALERIGKLHDTPVLPCQPSKAPLAYRNKIQLPSCELEGKIAFGLYAADSHDVVPVEKCFIHSARGEEVFAKVRHLCQKWGLKSQEIRHLLIKSSFANKEALVVFITWNKEVDQLPKVARELLEECPDVKGVFQNHNPGDTNRVLSEKFELLAGKPFIEEVICGLTFTVSPASFFQVNVLQAEALYKTAIEWAEISTKDRVLDAYCGVGTLSLILASQAKNVVGIEYIDKAIQDAKNNAKRNGISNAQFLSGDAEKLIEEVGPIDVALINPPRKGCSPSFLEKLMNLSPRTIIYISCDPATLARDLAFLKVKYQIIKAQPFDMFPQTAHVETVVQLILIN